MEMKKYQSIDRLGHKSTFGVLNEGSHIIIQEKIDGANASIRRVGEDILAFSRNNPLDDYNTLGGFYQFTQELDLEFLNENFILFGEWTNPHKVKYPNHQKEFFLYDIYDIEYEEYMAFEDVKNVSEYFGLNLIPVFYEGEYQSFEHLQSFVGKTALGGMIGDVESGEGIVVKNVNYRNRFGEQKFVKLVTDAFREVQKQKPAKDPQRALTVEQRFVDATVTPARVEKFLHKFVDEGILELPYGIEDMGIILKHMNQRIQEDILTEELENISELLNLEKADGYTGTVEGYEVDYKQLSKAVSRTVVKIVKPLLDK